MPGLEKFVELYQSGSSRPIVLAAMKQQGLTITATIKASMKIFEINLREAKLLVTSDPSWISTAQAAEPFHRQLVQLIDEMDGSVLNRPSL